MMRRLATGAALVATVVSLVASGPAAANTDQFGNSLFFVDAQGNLAPCNPSFAALGVGSVLNGYPAVGPGIAWVDYFGFPVAVSAPFYVPTVFGLEWPVPGPSATLPGIYTWHVLLLNGFYRGFSQVWDTATIAPGLNTDCTPISAAAARVATARPSARTLARHVRTARGHATVWFERSPGPPPQYPKARFCGRTICVQLRPGARWHQIISR